MLAKELEEHDKQILGQPFQLILVLTVLFIGALLCIEVGRVIGQAMIQYLKNRGALGELWTKAIRVPLVEADYVNSALLGWSYGPKLCKCELSH